MSDLTVTVDEGVCLAILDREERLNALDDGLMDGLIETCGRIAGDPSIRVLIISGRGRAFSVGADIGLLDGIATTDDSRAYIERIRDVYLAIEELPCPVIAAVNGYALGGGLELCLASDLVLASDRATFAFPEVRLGAIPGYATVRLVQVVGRLRAAELMMLGDRIDAEAAAAAGLVNRVVAADRLLEEALALARRLAAGPPLALAAIKKAMRGEPVDDMARFADAATAVLVSGDARRGMRAFASKEEPRFDGS
jgi:enoyl-CoA hydratase/carnithine racemase